MATPYTVNLPDGGQIVVNANSAQAALENAGNPAGATVSQGSYTSGSSSGSGQGNNPGTVGGGGGGGTSVDIPGMGKVSGMSAQWIDQYMQAIMTGNKAAADEAIRQFNTTHGLDQSKFDESVREYNQNFAQTQELQQAGLTGTYQGAPTMAAKALGLQAIQSAATLQANPFAQARALYGMNQSGLSTLMQGAAGLAPLPSFQAPHGSAADTASLGWLAGQGGAGSFTQEQSQQYLNGLPAPHQINWNELGRATPVAQNLVVQGLSTKFGLSPEDVMAIGKATLPGFTSPTLTGRVG